MTARRPAVLTAFQGLEHHSGEGAYPGVLREPVLAAAFSIDARGRVHAVVRTGRPCHGLIIARAPHTEAPEPKLLQAGGTGS